MLPELLPNESIRKTLSFTLVNNDYLAAWRLAELHREFSRSDYVRLPGLLTDEALAIIREEAERLEFFALHRDFIMPGLETPRFMHVLGGSRILQESWILWSLYFHHQLWQVLEGITHTPIYSCRHTEEFMVMNFLVAPGETHGWHLDDPAYAIILFLDAPSEVADGGILEYVPNWRDFCGKLGVDPENRVEENAELARAAGLVISRHHKPGDAYLLRADSCLHRVTRLSRDGVRRVVLNLGYESRPTTLYGTTASTLYSESSPSD